VHVGSGGSSRVDVTGNLARFDEQRVVELGIKQLPESFVRWQLGF
jgi:hypothetical protein